MNKAILDLCEQIKNSDLSDKVKAEAILLLKRNFIGSQKVRHYNKGIRPDSLN